MYQWFHLLHPTECEDHLLSCGSGCVACIQENMGMGFITFFTGVYAGVLLKQSYKFIKVPSPTKVYNFVHRNWPQRKKLEEAKKMIEAKKKKWLQIIFIV